MAAVRAISLVLTFESGMVLDSFPGWQQVMLLPPRRCSPPAWGSACRRRRSVLAHETDSNVSAGLPKS